MAQTAFDYNGEISWCPGCGDYKILESLKAALEEIGLAPTNVAVVSGIGQAAKMPHYLKCHSVNGLHGRALPLATGIKASNRGLTVIAVGGDGDMYGEGGNHFMHAIRRNPDITNIVCNNMIYGLTKGQGSPTTPLGMKTPTQPFGVTSQPLNPLLVALSCGADFVARASAADAARTKEIIVRAIRHKGYALVDIFQPCVSFNKVNTWQWLMGNTKWLDEDRDTSDKLTAMDLAMRTDPYLLGVFYERSGRASFEELQPPYSDGDDTPLYARKPKLDSVRRLLV
jgi:2-oxoglutarate ferredoxin oxidoreductase subunit beta